MNHLMSAFLPEHHPRPSRHLNTSIDAKIVNRSTVLAEIAGPFGKLEILGDVTVLGRRSEWRGVHVQGLFPGAPRRKGLNRIAEAVLKEIDADEIYIEGAIRTTGRRIGQRPKAYTYPSSIGAQTKASARLAD